MTRRLRRGMTLLEMIVVVASLTMIASTAGILLTAALRASRETTSALARHRALAQLDRQLRRDVSAGQAARIDDHVLRISRGKSHIVYEPQSAGIERRELDEEGKVVGRELYRLDAPIEVHWELAADSSQETVTLSFTPAPHRADVSEGWRGLRTTAVVGSDRRFSAKGTP